MGGDRLTEGEIEGWLYCGEEGRGLSWKDLEV